MVRSATPGLVDDPSVTGGVDGNIFGFDEGAGTDRGAGGGAGELGVVGTGGGGGGEFGLDGLCFGDLDGALGGGFGFALGGAPGLEAVARLGGGGEGDGLALAEFMAALGAAFDAGRDAGEGAFAAGLDRQGELGHGDGGAEDVDVFLGVGNVEVAGGVEGDTCEEFEGGAVGFGERFDEDAGFGEFVDRFRFGDEDVAVGGIDGDEETAANGPAGVAVNWRTNSPEERYSSTAWPPSTSMTKRLPSGPTEILLGRAKGPAGVPVSRLAVM